MRTVSDADTVRLYFVDPESGIATTLLYAPLPEALALAAQQAEEVREGLWLQTDNDVVAYADMAE